MPTVILIGAGAWPIPTDWTSAGSQIICIGAGSSGTSGGAGGGGGACAVKLNLSMNPGGIAWYSCGTGGSGSAVAGGNTWFNAVTNSQVTDPSQGALAAGGSAGLIGGQSGNSIGDSKNSGGNGGNATGGGGGGAAGFGSNGISAADISPSSGGAGGGAGAGGGGASSTSTTGGSGGGATTYSTNSYWDGSRYQNIFIFAGPGGGGGGSTGAGGGNGGAYGAGGGGGASLKTAGNGANGCIIIIYTSATNQIPSVGNPVTLNDINSVFYSTPTRSITLGDQEVRCLITAFGIGSPVTVNGTSTTFPAGSTNPPYAGYTNSGPITIGDARSKPVNVTSGTLVFNNPGTYTFLVPVHRALFVEVIGGGGGGGGGGWSFPAPPFNVCGFAGGNGGNSTFNSGGANQVIGFGGGAGACNSTGGNGGTAGADVATVAVLNIIPGGGGSGGIPNGGNGGGPGGSGGIATKSWTHGVTANHPIWANGSTISYTITVGGGGAGGGPAGPPYNDQPGLAGRNGRVTITWS